MTSPTRAARTSRLIRFARIYIIALASLLLCVWLAGLVLSFARGSAFDYSGQRPTPAVVAGYKLQYQVGSGAWSSLMVDADGKACDAIAQSQFLREACVLATNVDPTWGAVVAAGRLNNEDTPSFAAITWRAALARDGSQCEHGGLLDTRLAGCKTAAADGRATFSDSGVTVVISAP